uniref:Secreted protein n=1 Tax=Anopheles christyi TaxID=43041 RepID=A0A182K814_9DIPT
MVTVCCKIHAYILHLLLTVCRGNLFRARAPYQLCQCLHRRMLQYEEKHSLRHCRTENFLEQLFQAKEIYIKNCTQLNR